MQLAMLIVLCAISVILGIKFYWPKKKIVAPIAYNTTSNRTGWIPIGHRVLVRPDEKYETEVGEDGLALKKHGSIYVPQDVSERESYAWNQGTIIDWGPTAGRHFDGCTMEELGIKRGDKVLYNQYAGLTFKDDKGVGYRVINDQDLNMVWREPEDKPIEEA